MKSPKTFFAAAVVLLANLAIPAHAAPQAAATASLNFSLTFKDGSGAVLDVGYLHTDWGADITYLKQVSSGSQSLVYDSVHNLPVDGFSQSRTGSQGTASGQVNASGAYSAGIPTIGMSSHAEVGGGLLNAKSEFIAAGTDVYNLTFSDASTPIYLYIDYSYSIAFNTTVLDPSPSHAWEWQAGGSVTMSLAGGGRRAATGEFEYVYPYADPSPVFDSSKMELFKIYYSEWVAGAPSGSISGSDSLPPILLTREGFDTGIGWNLSAGVGTSATAPGIEAPIPEPQNYAMLLIGLGLLGLAGRRRK